jgi:hypothetical protein
MSVAHLTHAHGMSWHVIDVSIVCPSLARGMSNRNGFLYILLLPK